MTTEQFKALMEGPEYGYHLVTKIGDEWCGLHQQIFTVSLLVGLDETGYKYRYCYETWGEAIMAISVWDGKDDAPGNWIVRKGKAGGDFPNPNSSVHKAYEFVSKNL